MQAWLQDVKIYSRRNALRSNGVADPHHIKRSQLSIQMVFAETVLNINILSRYLNVFWKFDDYARIPVAGMLCILYLCLPGVTESELCCVFYI